MGSWSGRRWAMLMLLLAAACQDQRTSAPPRQAPPAPVVEVTTIGRGSVDEGLALVGQLEADESVMIRPESDGVVASIGFREGQEVAQGAVLFRLRDAEQRARLREAEAQVVVTEQAWTRASALAGERILSAAELDQAQAARDAARARLDLARVELERMTIRAPFAGILGRRLVSPGDRVTASSSLVQLDAVAALKISIPVPEQIVDRVKPGMPFAVSVAPYPGERFPGTVFFAAPSLDPANRQLLLRGRVPNPARRLRPGMFATVQIETARANDALLAPESAVVYDPQGTFVWRIGMDGTAERAPVTVGLRREGQVEIRSGLAEGDRVVSAGTNKVVAGRAVKIAGATSAPTQDAGS